MSEQIMFPLILENFQKPFLINTDYKIKFTLPTSISKNSIKHLQIKISQNSNNKSLIKHTETTPNGLLYLDSTAINFDLGEISLPKIEGWEEGSLYRIQVRYGLNELWTEKQGFAEWNKEQIGKFSEWSNIMVTKTISKPEVAILNSENKIEIKSENNINYIFSQTPTFLVKVQFNEASNEVLDKFKFLLYDENKNLLEETDWLQHKLSKNNYDEYRFNHALEDTEKYIIVYKGISNNGYEFTTQERKIEVQINLLNSEIDFSINTIDDDEFCKENGCIKILFNSKSNNLITGNYIISRASEDSNFKYWEDINHFSFNAEVFNGYIAHIDYFIESDKKYLYRVQKENSAGLRTSPEYEYLKPLRSVSLEYSYLCGDNRQLKLKFNNKINSIKKITLTNKINTLGSKYPTIVKNGDAYYTEFPISGTISLRSDEEGLFLQNNNQQEEYRRPSCGSAVVQNIAAQNENLKQEFYNERIFREEVEKFLNDGKYKLFRSPTEGNLIVALTNVSMTPNASLGRMIFDFSATASEIAENSLENLEKFNIMNKKKFIDFENLQYRVFGQLNGFYYSQTEKINLVDLIKKQVNYDIDENYSQVFTQLESICIERYPVVNLEKELLYLKALASFAENEEEKNAINKEILTYQTLFDAIKNVSSNSLVHFKIDEKPFSLGKNQKLYLKVEKDNPKIFIECPVPIVINYICVAKTKENVKTLYSSIKYLTSWGQFSGFFTETDNILSNYSINYKNFPNYQIEYQLIEFDKNGNPVFNGQEYKYYTQEVKYDMYKTKNIFEIIKEKDRLQLMKKENIQNFKEYNKEEDTWEADTFTYKFHDINRLEIEASEGTVLLLTNEEGLEIPVRIGATEKYVLNPASDMIRSLKFKEPTYAIINYSCSGEKREKIKVGN